MKAGSLIYRKEKVNKDTRVKCFPLPLKKCLFKSERTFYQMELSLSGYCLWTVSKCENVMTWSPLALSLWMMENFLCLLSLKSGKHISEVQTCHLIYVSLAKHIS